MVNPITRALQLRNTLIKDDEVLVAEFSNTLQGKDTSKVVDLMPNVRTGEKVFRAKVNSKAIDPIAAEMYGKTYEDTTKMTPDQVEEVIKRSEFDFPLWFKHDKGFAHEHVIDYNLPFILQVAGCNFHDGKTTGGCLYCFADNELNDGTVATGKTYLKPEAAVASFINAQNIVRNVYKEEGTDLELKVFRTSGGEPTIALDWILKAWDMMRDAGVDAVGQIDSNLSTGVLVESFINKSIYERDILQKLAEHPIKVLTAIKGTDEENLQDNVQAEASMETQRYSIIKFLNAGFDIYPQMYNPSPRSLERYLQFMDTQVKNFSLRVHIGPLKVYGPTKLRLTDMAEKNGLDPDEFIAQKTKLWDNNYNRGCEIIDDYLNHRYGVGYKDTVRSDVELRVKR